MVSSHLHCGVLGYAGVQQCAAAADVCSSVQQRAAVCTSRSQQEALNLGGPVDEHFFSSNPPVDG